MALPNSVGYSAWQPWELEKSTAIYQMVQIGNFYKCSNCEKSFNTNVEIFKLHKSAVSVRSLSDGILFSSIAK